MNESWKSLQIQIASFYDNKKTATEESVALKKKKSVERGIKGEELVITIVFDAVTCYQLQKNVKFFGCVNNSIYLSSICI